MTVCLSGYHLGGFDRGSLSRIDTMTYQEMPYVMVRSERNLTGNDRYEGFCIDLLKAIAGNILAS